MRANEFFSGVTIHATKSRIDFNEEPIQVHDNQGVVSGFKDAAILLFLLSQSSLSFYALGDVT